jgi:hypothetical protein
MSLTDREKEWAGRASRYLKARLKQADVGYKELARRLNEHGLQEPEDSFPASSTRHVCSDFLPRVFDGIGIGRITIRRFVAFIPILAPSTLTMEPEDSASPIVAKRISYFDPVS